MQSLQGLNLPNPSTKTTPKTSPKEPMTLALLKFICLHFIGLFFFCVCFSRFKFVFIKCNFKVKPFHNSLILWENSPYEIFKIQRFREIGIQWGTMGTWTKAGVYHNCSTRFADGFRYGGGPPEKSRVATGWSWIRLSAALETTNLMKVQRP